MVQKMEIKQKRANPLARAPVWALWGKQATQGRWGWSYQPGQQQRAQSFKSIQASVNYWGLQVRHRLSVTSAGVIAPSHCTQPFLTRPSNTPKLPPPGLCTFIFRLEQSSQTSSLPSGGCSKEAQGGSVLSSPLARPSLSPCCVDGVFQRCHSNLFHPVFFLPPLETRIPVSALTNRIGQKGCWFSPRHFIALAASASCFTEHLLLERFSRSHAARLRSLGHMERAPGDVLGGSLAKLPTSGQQPWQPNERGTSMSNPVGPPDDSSPVQHLAAPHARPPARPPWWAQATKEPWKRLRNCFRPLSFGAIFFPSNSHQEDWPCLTSYHSTSHHQTLYKLFIVFFSLLVLFTTVLFVVHSFLESDKAVVHVISFLWLWFSFCLPSDG